MIYEFADFARDGLTRKLDAQKVGEELERLRTEHGGKLEKKVVIEAARHPECPLHNAFTWDDQKAADRYRLREAQTLLSALVIVDEATGEETKAFWSVAIKTDDERQERNERYYQSVRVLKESPKEYTSALKLALMELEGAEITLQQLKRIAPSKEHKKIEKATEHILDAHAVLHQPAV